MEVFWKAFVKSTMEFLRLAVLLLVASLVTWLLEGGVKLFFDGINWDPTIEYALTAGITYGLRWLDKYIHELQKLTGNVPEILGVKYHGLVGA